jgi:hypothetical protein
VNGEGIEFYGEEGMFRFPCVSKLFQPENFFFTIIFSTLTIQEARLVNNPG